MAEATVITKCAEYDRFLERKRIVAPVAGKNVDATDINPQLFPFQRDIVKWAMRRGRAAVFADCGLGKTPIQLEWARLVAERVGRVLIVAPLAVSHQTEREGQKFGVKVTICRSEGEARHGVNITNYEMLHKFRPDKYAGIVLDESSILKGYDGVMRRQLTEFAAGIPYRLCCTATPAPNDLAELINHAEFLDIMTGKEIIALFFTQDGNTSHNWRLKGHAREDFWRWMASWSVALRKPSDLGYEDNGFILPPLNIHQEQVGVAEAPTGSLLVVEAITMDERRAARKDSIGERVRAVADLVNGSDEPWLIWCNLNAEGDAITKAVYGAVQVRGSDSIDYKERALLDFSNGEVRVLVTKPTIAGHGMNWQHCARVAFVGLSDSYEQFYQAVRRCWRFGQARPVECYVITAETEGAVVRNIERKEKQAADMFDNIVSHTSSSALGRAEREVAEYEEDVETGRGWTMYLGDSVRVIDRLETDSVGLSVFSPPFPGMYTYTNSPNDMGNVKDIDEMIEQFRFLIAPEKLLRVTMPGRSCCIHLNQVVTFKWYDGVAGLKDFRGRVISAMEDAGWVYYGEVCINKNPQLKAIRSKDRGLLFKTLATDSSNMHMALADYLLQFRKPGDNPRPIRAGISDKYGNPDGWITNEEWIEWAAPVWNDIREPDVLNVAQARETDDERHLCPLQLSVIERAVKLWSAPGDLVLDPFGGIGSSGVVAVKHGRDFVGIELKRSYFENAIRNIRHAEAHAGRLDLFSAPDDVQVVEAIA